MKFSATLVLATNVSDKSFFENISTKPSVKNICHQQHIATSMLVTSVTNQMCW